MEITRSLWSYLVQSHCSSQAPQGILPWSMPRWLWASLTWEDSTSFLDNLWQCSVTLTKCLTQHFLYFSLCPLLLVLSLRAAVKSLAASSLYSPFIHLHTLVRNPRAFLSPGWTGSLSLSPQGRKSSPFIILVAFETLSTISMFSSCWGGQSCTCSSVEHYAVLYREYVTSLELLATLCQVWLNEAGNK